MNLPPNMYEQNQTRRSMLICILLLYRLDGWINPVSLFSIYATTLLIQLLHPIFLKTPALSSALLSS